MNPNLFEMIKYGAKKGLSVNFTTNATLIHEIAGDLLSSDLDIVAFSIPDLSLFFQKIYNNIEYFHKCREKRGLTHPKTYMNVAMMGCNFDTVEETLSVSRRLGVDAVNFERSYLWRPEFSGKEDEVFRRADDFAAKTGLKIYLPVCHTLPCRLFNTTLFVRYNGDVTPCCYRPDKVLRNIASDSMDDIMSRRGTFRENMEKDPVCMACGI
ncbi:MoaA/NifB/PqqE/SkfB family radical SAM enzyme [Methanomicrobium sp. W14]|nr:MoaA/NifB/PqqE/SkfB family radical SAM enzyme [Methanomicrobium sp. W14]